MTDDDRNHEALFRHAILGDLLSRTLRLATAPGAETTRPTNPDTPFSLPPIDSRTNVFKRPCLPASPGLFPPINASETSV